MEPLSALLIIISSFSIRFFRAMRSPLVRLSVWDCVRWCRILSTVSSVFLRKEFRVWLVDWELSLFFGFSLNLFSVRKGL